MRVEEVQVLHHSSSFFQCRSIRIFNTFCDYFFFLDYKGEIAGTSQVCLGLLDLAKWQGAEVWMYLGVLGWVFLVFFSFFSQVPHEEYSQLLMFSVMIQSLQEKDLC